MGFRSTATRLGLDGPVGEDSATPAAGGGRGIRPLWRRRRFGCRGERAGRCRPAWRHDGDLPGGGHGSAWSGWAWRRRRAVRVTCQWGMREIWTGWCSNRLLADLQARAEPLLADPALLKVFHDAKAGLHAYWPGPGSAPIVAVDDCMLLSYAQDAGAHGHTLEELSRLHLGHGVTGLDVVTGNRAWTACTLADVPTERAAGHVAEAADCALRLRQSTARPPGRRPADRPL